MCSDARGCGLARACERGIVGAVVAIGRRVQRFYTVPKVMFEFSGGGQS